MEYLTFGPFLERCRFARIPDLTDGARALVFGDGDGRFLARLLAAHPHLHADAVDLSPAMLRLLGDRVTRIGARSRLTAHCADARMFQPMGDYDLIATHFFLDCLHRNDVETLIARLQPHLSPGALWLVSEFQIPPGRPVLAWLARGIIGFLYAAFRILTGLTVHEIPPWRALLCRAGFVRISSCTWLGGLLVSELWRAPQATASACVRSHQEVSLVTEPALHMAFPGTIPGIDPGPEPSPDPPPVPTPDPAPGPAPEPDPEPYPGPIPAPQPVT